MAGLYLGAKYIFGVPHREVHEHSTFGVDTKTLRQHGYRGLPDNDKGKFLDFDFVSKVRKENPKAIEDRILSRGYRFILSKLVKFGHISKTKAEKIFGVTLEPDKPDNAWIRRYLAIGI